MHEIPAERKTDPSTPPAREADAMTTSMMKAMTHPLRRAILRILPRKEHVRAADLVEELGEPANKISFHLRVLADAGLIAEAPQYARDRRDRVWVLVKGAHNLGSPQHPVEDEVLGAAVLAGLTEDHFDLVRRMVDWAPEYVTGRAKDVHGAFAQFAVRLTEAEFNALMERIQSAVEQAEQDHDHGAGDSRSWNLHLVAADDTL